MDEPTKYIDGVLYRLCACGTCGKYFVAHKNTGNGNKEVLYIKGHYCIGKHHSEISKEKNRQAHLGTIGWNKGNKGLCSEETLQKIRDARAKQVMQKGRIIPKNLRRKTGLLI